MRAVQAAGSMTEALCLKVRRILTAMAFLAFCGDVFAHAGAKPFSADENACRRPTPTEMAWLEAATWSPFAEFIRVCKVSHHNSAAPALLIISVWADLLYASVPARTETVAMPKPIILSPAGRKLGELPANFPSDPPSALILRFASWRGGIPREITLCIQTPTASGNQALPPLRYVPTIRRYESASLNRLGDCDGR